MPRFSATARYIARTTAAVELMVIETDTLSSGIPANRISMSSRVSTATPTFPTSPSHSGLSESSPIWVGRSKATLKPVCPWSSRKRYRRFDSSAEPNPAYCLIVQSFPRYMVGWIPRVKGYRPG